MLANCLYILLTSDLAWSAAARFLLILAERRSPESPFSCWETGSWSSSQFRCWFRPKEVERRR